MANVERARAAVKPAPREPWYNHWLIGVAMLAAAIGLAWLLAGAPAITITGW